MFWKILAVLGFILTVFSVVYAKWTNKKNRKKVSLQFKKLECYSLFKDDVSRLNIELIYNSKPVSGSLLLLKARLINNGQVDIDNTRIHESFKILSKKDFQWLEIRITSQPENIKSKIEILNSTDVLLEWDLLKAGEFIDLEALIEININNVSSEDKSSKFYDELTFKFRITELNSIQKEPQIFNDKRVPKVAIFVTIGILIVGLFILFNAFFPSLDVFTHNSKTEYLICDGASKKTGTFEFSTKDKVKFKVSETGELIYLPIYEFNIKYKIERIESTIVDNDKVSMLILGFMYSILGFIALFHMLFSNKPRNARKLIKTSQ
jgi:hypothetical protein